MPMTHSHIRSRRSFAAPRSVRGVGMVEVLVAVLVRAACER